MSDQPTYEVYAIRYAMNPRRLRGECFIKDPDPGGLKPIGFYFWLIAGNGQTIVVDTGIPEDVAVAHGQDFHADPIETLRKLDVDPDTVGTVIMTHLHFDHAGLTDAFPKATFHLQHEEMAFVTGPLMEKSYFRYAYDPAHVQRFVGYLYSDRLHLHGREHAIADGVTAHWVGGHCPGQEIVRVRTKRGWVVLASDALHFYEEYERGIPFAIVHSTSDMLKAHDRIRELADSDDHVIPAHDPLVIDRYPAASGDLKGIVARVDLPPV